MKIESYLCVDRSHGRIADASDDSSPLVKVEFCNEVNKFSEQEKRCFLQMVKRNLAACLRMWYCSETPRDATDD